MAIIKQSYKEVTAVFLGTDYGKVRLDLAVGQKRVTVRDSQGIKLTCNREEVEDKDHPLLNACREKDEKKFLKFIEQLGELDA